jgi:hypothetical protein
MDPNALKRKTVSTETMFEENISFGITGNGRNEGTLENGVLVPNAGSIIINERLGINERIPGIKNIWITANCFANNNFTIHVRTCSSKGKECNILEFQDGARNVYKMEIDSHYKEQIYIMHYTSTSGNILKIKWGI